MMNNKIAIIYKKGKVYKEIDCCDVVVLENSIIIRGYVNGNLVDKAMFKDVEFELKSK